MSSILHRLTIDAAPKHVQELVATKKGIELWWTGQGRGFAAFPRGAISRWD